MLAQIDPRPYQAALDGATANLPRTKRRWPIKRDLSRYQDTAAKGYSSRQQLDTQSSTVTSLMAAVQADQALSKMPRCSSAIHPSCAAGGRTGIRIVDQGNIVHANDAGAWS